jgi:hypothetical protein
MITKEKLLETIKAMPEEKFDDVDVILERIVLLEKLENGESDIDNNQLYSIEQAREKLSKWLK